MIITCPHCQTKYQVTFDAIGSAGRKVQCAHCQQAWQQAPIEPEPPVSPETAAATSVIVEDTLDEAMEAEARAVAAEKLAKKLAAEAFDAKQSEAAGKIDPDVIRNRQRAFTRRQDKMIARLPLARFRRAARVVLALMLVGIGLGLYFLRVPVVSRFPAMAGVYAAIGLPVNVVGLEFSNLTTLRTLRDGKEMLIVSAQILGIAAEPAPVPPVVVTLIDSHGQGVYEWSVTPAVRDLMRGERATFDTQLILPPGDAARVRLSFAGGTRISDATPAPGAGAGAVPAPEPTDHAEPAAADAHAGNSTEHAAPAETAGASPDHAAPADTAGVSPAHANPEHH